MAKTSEYDDWQLGRIRQALDAYRLQTRDQDGKPLTWTGVHYDIADYTGFKINDDEKKAYESLRRFVNGVPDHKTGERLYKNPEWVTEIVRFLIHPDVAYLSEHELEKRDVDMRAAVYLSRFFNGDRPESEIGLQANISQYESRRDRLTEILVTELFLEPYLQEDVYKATIVENYFAPSDDFDWYKPFDKGDSHQKFEEREAYYVYSGWAVHSPENELLICVRSGHGENNIFYALSEFNHSDEDVPALSLALKKSSCVVMSEADQAIDLKALSQRVGKEFMDTALVFVRRTENEVEHGTSSRSQEA